MNLSDNYVIRICCIKHLNLILTMNPLPFLCLLVTHTVICIDHTQDRRRVKYYKDVNDLLASQSHNEIEQGQVFRYGSFSNRRASDTSGGKTVKRQQEENAGEIVKNIVTILANNIDGSGK